MAVDRRIVKTKEALKAAMVSLLEEKELSKITVKELCERADINRGTFYTHYADQVDLYRSIENELYCGLETYIRSLTPDEVDSPENSVAYIVRIFKYCRFHADYISVFTLPHRKSLVCQKIVEFGKKYNLYGMIESTRNKPAFFEDYFYEYISLGVIGIINLWMEKGMVESDEQMAQVVFFFVRNTINDSFLR